jgi:hypothetical protein
MQRNRRIRSRQLVAVTWWWTNRCGKISNGNGSVKRLRPSSPAGMSEGCVTHVGTFKGVVAPMCTSVHSVVL